MNLIVSNSLASLDVEDMDPATGAPHSILAIAGQQTEVEETAIRVVAAATACISCETTITILAFELLVRDELNLITLELVLLEVNSLTIRVETVTTMVLNECVQEFAIRSH